MQGIDEADFVQALLNRARWWARRNNRPLKTGMTSSDAIAKNETAVEAETFASAGGRKAPFR